MTKLSTTIDMYNDLKQEAIRLMVYCRPFYLNNVGDYEQGDEQDYEIEFLHEVDIRLSEDEDYIIIEALDNQEIIEYARYPVSLLYAPTKELNKYNHKQLIETYKKDNEKVIEKKKQKANKDYYPKKAVHFINKCISEHGNVLERHITVGEKCSYFTGSRLIFEDDTIKLHLSYCNKTYDLFKYDSENRNFKRVSKKCDLSHPLTYKDLNKVKNMFLSYDLPYRFFTMNLYNYKKK